MCKRAIVHVAEAHECLGGNGFVEECILPRLYRESPVNSLWEGSGNIMCLDVLRAAGRDASSLSALWAEIDLAHGVDPRFDAMRARVRTSLGEDDLERGARRIAEGFALLLEASLVLRFSPPAVADAFCAARLGEGAGLGLGALPPGVDVAAILRRAPAV